MAKLRVAFHNFANVPKKVYVADVKLMGENNRDLLDASRKDGLQNQSVCFMSRHQHSDQCHVTNIHNKSLEHVSVLNYLEKTVTDQNFTYDEIQSILNSGSSSDHLVQIILYSRLLSNRVMLRTEIV